MLSDHDSCTEIDSIVKELCAAYLVGIPGQRAQIQNLVAEQWALGMRVQALPEKMTAEIVSLQDVTKLRYALAAMSIERGRSDYRDTLTVLADLFVRAKEVGMDPVPHFQAVGEISSTQALHDGDTPLAEMLREFHTYAIVAEWRPMESWARYFLVLIAIIVLILMITYLLG